MSRDEIILTLAGLGAAGVILWFALRDTPTPVEKRTCSDSLFDAAGGAVAGAGIGSAAGIAGPQAAGIGGLLGFIGGGAYTAATDATFRECTGETIASAQRWAKRNPDETAEIVLLVFATGVAAPLVLTKELAEYVFGEDVFGLGAPYMPDTTHIYYVVAHGGADSQRAIVIHGAGTADMRKFPPAFRLAGLDYDTKRKPTRDEQIIVKSFTYWLHTRYGISGFNKRPEDYVAFLRAEAEYNRRNPADLRPRKPNPKPPALLGGN